MVFSETALQNYIDFTSVLEILIRKQLLLVNVCICPVISRIWHVSSHYWQIDLCRSLHTIFMQQITSKGQPLLMSSSPCQSPFILSNPILWIFATQCRSDSLSLARYNVHSCVPIRVCGCSAHMCELFEQPALSTPGIETLISTMPVT